MPKPKSNVRSTVRLLAFPLLALIGCLFAIGGCKSQKQAEIRPQITRFDIPDKYKVDRSERTITGKKKKKKKLGVFSPAPTENPYVKYSIQKRRKRQRAARNPQYSDPRYLGKKDSPKKRRKKEKKKQKKYIKAFKKRY